jgi:bifunctional DNase/RNase
MTRRLHLRFTAVAAVALAQGIALPAAAREPVVEAGRLQVAQYVGVAPVPGGDGAAVALAVDDGAKVVPIFIGPVEAAAIDRAERGLRPPRPLTHELMADLLAAAGGAVDRVVIDDLRDGVYYATVSLRRHGGDRVWVDARPSDALALALRQRVPILLGPAVVASAADPGLPPAGAVTLAGLGF